MTTICRRRRPTRRLRSSHASPKRRIALKNASAGPRAKPVWPTTRFGRGGVGIIIKHCRCWPPGFLRKKPGRGKKSTPAITVPQIRALLAASLHRKLNCDYPEVICRQVTRRLQRNEIARYYHWKKRKRLAPKRIHQRR